MPTTKELRDFALQEAGRAGLSPNLVNAVIRQESGWNPGAVSSKGARGVMQLMPATAKELGVNPDDPFDNIRGGVKYLKQQLNEFKDEKLALAAYNAGPGAVRKYGGVPPYKETQNYTNRIMQNAGEKQYKLTPVDFNPFESEKAGPKLTPVDFNPFEEKPEQSDGTMASIAKGFNKGVAGLAGLPVDTANNILNLGKAAAGVVAKEVFNRPDLMPTVTPNENSFGGSASIERGLNKLGMQTDGSGFAYNVGQFMGGATLPASRANLTQSFTKEALTEALTPKNLAVTGVAATGAATGQQIAPNSPIAPLLGAVAPAAGAGAAVAAINKVRPHNLVVQNMAKNNGASVAVEGEALSKKVPIDMSPGQESGNKAVLTLENMARQSPITQNKILLEDQRVANQAIDYIGTLANRMSAVKNDPTQMGAKLRGTIDKIANEVISKREAQATADYGKVRQLSNGAPIVEPKNLVAELESILADNAGVAGADAAKVTNQAKLLLNGILKPKPTGSFNSITGEKNFSDPKFTVDQAIKSRSFYGRAARGGANVFEDLAPESNRRFAARLFGAMTKDLEEAGGVGGEIGKAFKVANDNYRNHSQALTHIENTALGKLLGEDFANPLNGQSLNSIAPEKLAKRITELYPSDAKAVTALLRTHAPNVLDQTKSYILRQSLEKAMDLPPSTGANPIPISYTKFIKELPKPDKLKALGFNPAEIKDIANTTKVLTRIGDRTGYNFSNTDVRAETRDIISSVKGGLAKGGLYIGGKFLGMNAIADAMTTAEGRIALKRLALMKNPLQIDRQIAAIAAISNREKEPMTIEVIGGANTQ